MNLLIKILPIFFLTIVNAHAALIDRGNGMVYDSDQDITWLQNANSAGGPLNWASATTWADDLVYGGYDDWRLPSAGAVPENNVQNGESVIENCPPGVICRDATDFSQTTAETSGLFYTANYETLFTDIQPGYYWLAEEYSSTRAWRFSIDNGHQNNRNKGFSSNAWAVRSGDVTAVPVPAAAWLMVSALGALLGLKRTR
jgi:hypothetical protein